jgi:hypothetical protein
VLERRRAAQHFATEKNGFVSCSTAVGSRLIGVSRQRSPAVALLALALHQRFHLNSALTGQDRKNEGSILIVDEKIYHGGLSFKTEHSASIKSESAIAPASQETAVYLLWKS